MANGYRGFPFYVFLCNLVQILLWIVHCGNCTRDMSQIDDEKWSPICPFHNMFYVILLELFNVIQSKVFYVRSPIAITYVDFFFDQNFRFTNAIWYGYISMTSLLPHTVAQPTKWRFLPKNSSQLVIFVIGLVFTWA